MPDYATIYNTRADDYDRLVAREDARGNLFAALMEIRALDGLTCADLGTGTGRMARWLALLARRVYGFDVALPMLRVAAQRLEETGLENWALAVADHRALPLPAASVDVAVQGWSFVDAAVRAGDAWRAVMARALDEMARIVRPGGTQILIETMGTGVRQPAPPRPFFADLYQGWQQEHGFQHRWVRTDFHFESVDEAEALSRFFFGDALADRVRDNALTIVPECTGIWWRTV